MPPKIQVLVRSRWDPFRLFLLLAAINAFLSYAPLRPGMREALSILYLPLLAVMLWKSRNLPPAVEDPRSTGPRPWVPAALAVLLACLMSLHLADYAAWPLYDEGINALYALDNLHGWDGRLHYYYSSIPPMQVWLLALLFKFAGVGRFSLWLLPALLVFGSVLLLYASARRLMSPAAALGVLAFGGFSFWALEAARISHPYVLVLFWGSLCLYAALRVAQPGPLKPVGGAFLLGALSGAGFYTFYSWPVVALAVGAVYFHRLKTQTKASPGFRVVLAWAVPLLLAAAPVLWDLARGAYDAHVLPLLNLSFSAASVLDRLRYVTSLFWVHEEDFRCGPFLGGLLNPVEGALFFLGCLELLRRGRRGPGAGVALLFLLLFLPAWMSRTVHYTRVVQLMIPSFFVCVLGWGLLQAGCKRPRVCLVGIWVVSALLNAFHLWGPARDRFTRPEFWGKNRTVEHFKAFSILEGIAREQGPGALITRLDSASFDILRINPCLDVLSHPWNVLSNPDLPASGARWAAVYTNYHHMPYLSRRFPGGRWFSLTDRPEYFTTDYVLGVYPLSALPGKTLAAWEKASEYLVRLDRKSLDDPRMTRDPSRLRLDYLDSLQEARDLFGGDPFLGTLLLEKIHYLCWLEKVEFDRERFFEDCLKRDNRSPYLLVMASRYLSSRGDSPRAAALVNEASRAYSRTGHPSHPDAVHP